MNEIKLVARSVEGETTLFHKKILFDNLKSNEMLKDIWFTERLFDRKSFESVGEYQYIRKVVEKVLDGYEIYLYPLPRSYKDYKVEIEILDNFKME